MQQLAKLSKRMEALAKENTEVGKRVVAKQTELAQLGWNWKKLVGSSCDLRPPPTPPPSQALRGQSLESVCVASSGMAVVAELLLPSEGKEKGSKRLRVSASGEEAPSLQQILAAQDTVLRAGTGVHHGIFPASSLTAGARINRE